MATNLLLYRCMQYSEIMAGMLFWCIPVDLLYLSDN